MDQFPIYADKSAETPLLDKVFANRIPLLVQLFLWKHDE